MKVKKLVYTFGIAGLLSMGTGAAAAHDLAIVNFGGAAGEAQQKAFIEPLSQELGVRIINEAYNGELARVKAMVETNNVVWDVVEVETADLGRGCDEGLFEVLDWNKLGIKDDTIPEAYHECGVGTFVWSTVMVFNTKTLDKGPASWAEFWDVEKFPGKRGLRKGARYNLEFALMADGVPVNKVYDVLGTPEGIDRAFNKLDELKPHIQWWEAGAQPLQMLAAGDVIVSSAYNGRIAPANREGQAFEIVWNQSIYDLDYWVIPQGSPNKELAEKFIQYASSEVAQIAHSKLITYGAINKKAIDSLDEATLADMPNSPENAANALLSSYDFWADHGEELDQRFSAWSTR